MEKPITDDVALSRIRAEVNYIDTFGVDAMSDTDAAKFLSARIRDIRAILSQSEFPPNNRL
jgi:hypothetical protein